MDQQLGRNCAADDVGIESLDRPVPYVADFVRLNAPHALREPHIFRPSAFFYQQSMAFWRAEVVQAVFAPF
jgi:hypothetical protein